jgi:hypothetical protein
LFQRLDDRMKKWMINSVMTLAVALLILGFAIGQQEDNQAAQTPVNNPKEMGDSFAAHESETPDLEQQTMEEYYAEDYGDMKEIENTQVDESQSPPALEDVFSEEEITESKAAAEQFVTSYYYYDGKDPLQNIENSKEAMSPDLYAFLMESPERPTALTVKRELASLEIIEPFASSAEVMTWNAKASGIVTDKEGAQRQETDLYMLKLEKIKGEYKVTDFLINYLQ